MKNWFQNFGQKFQAWMYGRNGYDALNRFLTVLALICIVLSMFLPLFSILGLALLIWSIFRSYSRNLVKRQQECEKYLRFTGGIKQFFKMQKTKFQNRKTHKYFKCPICKTYLRVPKGRGTIEITCPKCQNKIKRKT